jgi:uncharacterized membrane protein
MHMITMGGVAALLVAVAALGAALVAGVFFAFSTFVMAGLDRSGPDHASPAMRGINVAAVRPPLMLLLFGTLVLELTAAIALLVSLGWSLASWLGVVGFATYAVGVVVVTASGNVPLNNRLAAPDAGTREDAWRAYAGPWTRLNHVRTLAAAASSALLLTALSSLPILAFSMVR